MKISKTLPKNRDLAVIVTTTRSSSDVLNSPGSKRKIIDPLKLTPKLIRKSTVNVNKESSASELKILTQDIF